ncbi:hypothetical protein N7668_09825 [Pseudomonas fulva]|uniref:hypothetical protein n=1 Tax=Pseudomonas fulva TaxID=47880 RepID=UPI00244880E6|nr:hypothetical protein [Pseudomonas fulva]MDH0571548.1 hypothetical protein [Pseudomonas fulva]
MITLNNLPRGFVSYDCLEVISNKIVSGAQLFSVGQVLPLLIGKGAKPQIWLSALQAPNTNSFIELVEASISKHPWVRVEESDGRFLVKLQGATILSIRQIDADQATVDALDMRPLGFSVYGDASGLHMGNVHFARNTVRSIGVLASFES